MSNAQAIASIRRFSDDLRRLPERLAHEVAEAAAPELTKLSQANFNASENPYGVPWDPSIEGEKVTLRQTGLLARTLVYKPIGRKLRMQLGPRYAKYQVGKRRVAPTQGAALPPEWSRTLARIAVQKCRAHFGGRR